MDLLKLSVEEAALLPLFIAALSSDDLISPKALYRAKAAICDKALASIWDLLKSKGLTLRAFEENEHRVIRLVARFKWPGLIIIAFEKLAASPETEDLGEKVGNLARQILSAGGQTEKNSEDAKILRTLQNVLNPLR